MSYETTGSPSLCDAQVPPSDWKRVFPAAGPYCKLPVALSKTAKLVLFHCTNCVAPTRPFTSGGLLDGTNPAVPVPTPSKPEPTGEGADNCCPCAVWSGPSRPPFWLGGVGRIGSGWSCLAAFEGCTGGVWRNSPLRTGCTGRKSLRGPSYAVAAWF